VPEGLSSRVRRIGDISSVRFEIPWEADASRAVNFTPRYLISCLTGRGSSKK